MKMFTQYATILGFLSLASALGCASAYQRYSGCQVPCRNCPLPPLPYVSYPACVCHSNAAMQYIAAPTTYVVPDETPQADVPPLSTVTPVPGAETEPE